VKPAPLSKVLTPLSLVAGSLALLPLAAHAYLGTFSRYLADDFCTASSLRSLGFAASQAHWYETWSGRFSFTFVVSLAQAVGPRLTPWLPSLAILTWLAAWLYFGRKVLGDSQPMGWLVWIPIGAVQAFATLRGAPNVYQSLYWQTGMTTYVLPVALAIAYAGWMWPYAAGGAENAKPGWGVGFVSFVVAFVLGGFSETYVALQTTALGMGLFLSLALVHKENRAKAATLIGVALIGSILAGLAQALAPGTQVRSGLMPPHPALVELVQATLKDGYLFLARTVKGSPAAIALAVGLPCSLILIRDLAATARDSIGEGMRRRTVTVLILLPVLIPVLMLSTIAPYEYAISSYPDARVLVSTMFVLAGGLAVWGAALGRLLALTPVLKSRRGSLAALGLAGIATLGLALASIQDASSTLASAPVARSYAQTWDKRDADLRRIAHPGEGPVATPSLRHMGGLAEIGRDPEEWINRCVAGTYGLEAVVAK
jgi:hypothetical protein